jgi:hypothetical protein
VTEQHERDMLMLLVPCVRARKHGGKRASAAHEGLHVGGGIRRCQAVSTGQAQLLGRGRGVQVEPAWVVCMQGVAVSRCVSA